MTRWTIRAITDGVRGVSDESFVRTRPAAATCGRLQAGSQSSAHFVWNAGAATVGSTVKRVP